MSGDERRTGARLLTELSVVLRPSKGGEPIDDRAVAHDVSIKGFKVETQAQLADNMLVSFTLELPKGETAAGKGRVVWTNRETFACWAGVEILSMPWSDKRRLGRLLDPDSVDWDRLTSLSVTLVMALTMVAVAHRVLTSGRMRELAVTLAPKIIALLVMGWALAGLLKRPRR
ncbi:MAG: PilZ domain-containing protein [Elusimicrobia bacterium]|nr:PilZ domain-containing protein [Elusimicrobiota bacterium]